MAGEMGKWEDFLTCVVTSEGLEKGSHREGELPTRCTSDRQTAAGKWQWNVCTEDCWRTDGDKLWVPGLRQSAKGGSPWKVHQKHDRA